VRAFSFSLLVLTGSCSLLLSGSEPTEDASPPEIDGAPNPSCSCTSQAPYCGSDGTCYAECVDLPPTEQGLVCRADTPARPLCERRGCVECVAHEDCLEEGEVCDVIAGTCRGFSNLFVVDRNKAGTACTFSDPCATIEAAVDVVRLLQNGTAATIAVFPGVYVNEVIGMSGLDIRMLAHGAALEGESRIEIRNDGKLVVEGFRFNASPPMALAEPLSCATGAELTLKEVTIENSDLRAANVETCVKLTIERSVVRDNASGLRVFDTEIDISNSLFAENNGLGATPAAVTFLSMVTGRFVLNTVSGNASAVDGNANGVRCVGTLGTFAGNAVGDTVDSSCPFTNSVVTGGIGDGVIPEDPMLDANHRPMAQSPGNNQSSIESLVGSGDRDLGLVPRNSPPDMGAYEF